MMFIESIGYTATLIDYVAQLTEQPIPEVVSRIGVKHLTRIIYNAPMNQCLPILKIAKEVIYDCDNLYCKPSAQAVPNEAYGNQIMLQVKNRTLNKNKYAQILFDLLTESK